MKADELHEAGDLDGYGVWRRIIRALDELLRKIPVPASAYNEPATPCPATRAAATCGRAWAGS